MAREKLWRSVNGDKLYVFNWIGGGFNDVWAINKAEAIKKAEDGLTLKVDKSTLRAVTKTQWYEWNKSNQLLWI
jgi:hypothetical protein